MSAFYSILYANSRPLIGERLAIGLFLMQNEKILFYSSKMKLDIAKEVHSKDSYKLLKFTLQTIQQSINNKKQDNATLFHADWRNYFEYLSKYCNNILTFSKPTPINVEVSFENFSKLYGNMIAPIEELSKDFAQNKKLSLKEDIGEKLYPKIKAHVDIEYSVSNLIFPNLISTVQVDFIGKNDRITAGHIVDFTTRKYNLEAELFRIIGLHTAIDSDKKNSFHFIIADEPERNTHNHELWSNFRKQQFIHYVPSEEIEIVEKYLEEHKVQPLSLTIG